jgi:glutamine amidotransferase-like uncharacterized protein
MTLKLETTSKEEDVSVIKMFSDLKNLFSSIFFISLSQEVLLLSSVHPNLEFDMMRVDSDTKEGLQQLQK